MTDRELMQQALVALEAMQSYAAAEKKGLRICDEAIEALRARLEKWTARDMAYRPGGLSQSEQEPKADVCCQDFENCVRSCTPRGQWIAHVRCGCGDQIMPDDGAECGACITARNAVKPDLAQVGEVGVWGEQQLPLKARHAAQEALNALMRWQEICLAKNRSTKELTIPTKAIHALTEILEVKGGER